jgi:hypothetical protein
MKVHELKTDPEPFDDVRAGVKHFEIRRNDRDFAVGDELLLRRTEHTGEAMAGGAPLAYTGESCAVRVTHIMRGPIYGLAAGWCVMSVERA